MSGETWAVLAAVASALGALGYLVFAVARNGQEADAEKIRALDMRVDALAARVERSETGLVALRDETHTSYVRASDLRELRSEIRQDFASVFERLNGISREMAGLVGRLDAARRDRAGRGDT